MAFKNEAVRNHLESMVADGLSKVDWADDSLRAMMAEEIVEAIGEHFTNAFEELSGWIYETHTQNQTWCTYCSAMSPGAPQKIVEYPCPTVQAADRVASQHFGVVVGESA